MSKRDTKQLSFLKYQKLIKKQISKSAGCSCINFECTKIALKKYIEVAPTFCRPKLRRTMYVKTISISRWSKLRWRKHVNTTSTFHPSKFHRKSASKRRRNSSKFCFLHIDITSTSLWCRLDIICPLNNTFFNFKKFVIFSIRNI